MIAVCGILQLLGLTLGLTRQRKQKTVVIRDQNVTFGLQYGGLTIPSPISIEPTPNINTRIRFLQL